MTAAVPYDALEIAAAVRSGAITALAVTETRYPRRRQALLKEWRAIENIPPP